MGMAASLMIGVSADISGAAKQMASLANDMKNVGESAKGAAANFKTLVSAELAADAIREVAGAMFNTAKASLTLAGELEQSKVAFTTMLGSAQKADAFLKELATFAANTPFELKGLQDSSKKLLAFGFDSRDIIPIMTSLGNAVAGLGGGEAEINRVTMALGQMSAKGKVSAEEMMQLAELGIPAWDMLAKSIGVSVPEAMKQAEKGAIPASKAIEGLVNGMNERFPNMMAQQSKTLLGAWSNLQDGITQTLTNIGTEMIKTFNLTPIISNVAGAVAAFGREIESSGIAGALNKAFSPELKAAILGVGVALTAAMVPALGTAAMALGAWVVAAAPFIATAAAIAFAAQPIIKNWDTMAQEFQVIFNAIGALASDVYQTFRTAFQGVMNFVGGALGKLKDMLKPVWDMLPEGVKSALASVGGAVATLPGVVIPSVRNMVSGVGKATADMGRLAFSPVYDAVDATKGFFADMTKAIPTMTQGMSGKVQLHMKQVAGAVSSETDKAAKAAKRNAEHIAKTLTELPMKLNSIDLSKALNLGDESGIKKGISTVKAALLDLAKHGLSATSPDVKKLTGLLATLETALKGAAERAEELERGGKAMSDFSKRMSAFTGLNAKLADINATFKFTGDAVEMNQDKAKAYEEAIKTLIKQGVDPLNPLLQKLRSNLVEIGQATDEAKRIESLNKTFADVAASISAVDAKAAFWGSSFDAGTEKAKVLESAINKLLSEGFSPASKEVQDLAKQLEGLKPPNAKVAEWFKGIQDKSVEVLTAINGLKDGLSTFAEELGIKFDNPVGAAVEKMGKLTTAAFQVGTSIITLWPHFVTFAGVLTTTVFPAIATTATALGVALGGALSGIGASVLAAVPAMAAWAATLWTTVVPATTSWAVATVAATWPILAIAAAVGVAIAAGVALVQNWDVVSAKMAEVWTAISNGCRAAFEGLSGFVGGIFDAISASIKSNINTLIGAMNFLIRGLNSIKIQVPSWVPKIGGMGWGGPNLPEIPMLAKGALVDSPTLAMVGEGRHREAVLPLSPSVFSQLAQGITALMPPAPVFSFPAPAYAGAMSEGGGTTIHINLEYHGGPGGRQAAAEMMEMVVKELQRRGIKAR